MAKRSGYVYERPGRAGAQVTGSQAKQKPESYATHGKTPVDRAQGKMMLTARRQGWSIDPTELGTEELQFARGADMELRVTFRDGKVHGQMVSRKPVHKGADELEARINFEPTRGIPSPGQVNNALARRWARLLAGQEQQTRDRDDIRATQ